MLCTLVYGMLFCMLGVLWKHGILLAIPFAAWELGMMLTTLGAPDASILRFSIIGWAMNIVDAAAALVWLDNGYLMLVGEWGGGSGESLQGTGGLMFFSSQPGLGISPLATIIVSTLVLLFQASICWLIGGAIFKSKEID